MLAKDMFTQGKFLEKFYLNFFFETCVHYRKRKDCIIVYIYDGNKHGKVVLVWGKPLPIFLSKDMGYSLCVNDTWGVMG